MGRRFVLGFQRGIKPCPRDAHRASTTNASLPVPFHHLPIPLHLLAAVLEIPAGAGNGRLAGLFNDPGPTGTDVHCLGFGWTCGGGSGFPVDDGREDPLPALHDAGDGRKWLLEEPERSEVPRQLPGSRCDFRRLPRPLPVPILQRTIRPPTPQPVPLSGSDHRGD